MNKGVCLIIGAKNPDQVVHEIMELDAEQYFIYEGDKGVCSAIQRRLNDAKTEQFRQVTVIQQFVSADGAPATYYQLNEPQFNSLAKPFGVFERFPNLKIISTNKFFTLPIVKIVKKHLCEGARSILVINESSQANTLVSELVKAGVISGFSFIRAESTTSELFEGSQTTNELCATLEAAGFILKDEHRSQSDPNFPRFSFIPDGESIDLKSFNAELLNLKQAHDKTLKQLKEKEAEKESLALQNLNLISENASLKKQNDLISKELDKIEIQMNLFKEIIK